MQPARLHANYRLQPSRFCCCFQNSWSHHYWIHAFIKCVRFQFEPSLVGVVLVLYNTNELYWLLTVVIERRWCHWNIFTWTFYGVKYAPFIATKTVKISRRSCNWCRLGNPLSVSLTICVKQLSVCFTFQSFFVCSLACVKMLFMDCNFILRTLLEFLHPRLQKWKETMCRFVSKGEYQTQLHIILTFTRKRSDSHTLQI